MKRTIGIETDNLESSTEIENLTAITPSRISDHESENFSSVSVASEEVARQFKAVIDT